MRVLPLILMMLGLTTACQSNPDSLPQTRVVTVVAPATLAPQDPSDIGFTHEGLSVSLPKPAGWESFTTEYGVVIAEHFGTVADQGTLQGLMAYVFVTPLTDLPTVDTIAPVNHAQQVLAQIVSDGSFIGTAQVSTPIGFMWDGVPAAYYLLNDHDSRLKTLSIGVAIPDSDLLLIGTLSAPLDEAEAIRAALEPIFGALSVNGTVMQPIGLDSLPDPLIFP